MPSLTGTDYDFPDLAQSQASARTEFLVQLQVIAPKVLNDLADKPLKALQTDIRERARIPPPTESLGKLIGIALSYQVFTQRDALWQYQKAEPRHRRFSNEFCIAMNGWVRQNRLFDDWILEQALRTLKYWVATLDRWLGSSSNEPLPSIPQEWGVFPSSAGWLPSLPDALQCFSFAYQIPGLQLNRIKRKDLQRKIETNFQSAMSCFLDSLDAYYRQVDETPEQFGLAKPVMMDNSKPFEWAVRYVVLRETQAKIADSENLDIQAINKGIKKVSNLIDLTLPKQRGRPRKTQLKKE